MNGDPEFAEIAVLDMRPGQVGGHHAPAEAVEHEVEAVELVDEAPGAFAHDHAPETACTVGEGELHVLVKLRLRDRRADARERVARAGDDGNRDVAEEFHLHARHPVARRGIDRQPGIAFLQGLLGRAQPLAVERDRDRGVFLVKGFQRADEHVVGKDLFDGDADLGLGHRGDAAGAGAQGVDPADHAAGVDQDRLARVGQAGEFLAAVEKLEFQRVLERLDGLADGRLHAVELAGGGGKAAAFGDGGQHVELVYGDPVQHTRPPSTRPTDGR